MACIFLSRRSGRSVRAPLCRVPLCLSVAALLALASPALAQIRGYYSSDPNVSVDLSVLGGPGNETIVTTPLHAPGLRSAPGVRDVVRLPSDLQFPPPAPPQSRLVGRFSAMSAPTLRQPAPQGAPQSRLTAPQSRLIAPPPVASKPAPKSVAAPKPKSVAAPKPKSVATPKPKSVAAPKPPAAPAVQPVPARTVAKASATRAVKPAPMTVPPPPTLPQPTAMPEPAVPLAPAPLKPASPVETAALTPSASQAAAPSAAPAPDGQVRILFDGGSAKLPDAARDSLQLLVSKLSANGNWRVQLEAYAKGTKDTASQARRLSLSRALAVRSYLIDQGVRSTRMDVRALGNKPSDPPAPLDRVDARLVER